MRTTSGKTLLDIGRGLQWLPAAIMLSPMFAFGDTSQTVLSPARLFYRCYSHLTQSPPAPNHPLLLQVQAGTLAPVAACMQVFDEAMLVSSGANQGNLAISSAEGLAVLKTFNDFHRSWFPSDSLLNSVPTGFDSYYLTAHINDETEPAYHITRTLFTPGVNFSDIVLQASPMEALRSNGLSNFESLQSSSSQLMTGTAPGNVTTYTPLNAELVQTGVPIGVRPMSLNSSKINQMVNDTDILSDSTYTVQEYASTSEPVHQSLGAGLIGTRSYLLLNLGRPTVQPNDGGLVMPRRWAKAVIHDLLCRDIPAIRLSDATPLVEKTITASTPPFRSSASCMQCHGVTDSMAGVIRNVTFFPAPNHIESGMNGFMGLYVWPVTRPSEPTADSDLQFYHTPPQGTFMFRSYDGTLVDQSLNNISDLGTALSNSNDLYACAAARYYQFFTGVGVNLQDIGDTSLPTLSSAEMTYRNDVITLGQNLKSSQNLRTLIQAIISLPLYQTDSMRYPGP